MNNVLARKELIEALDRLIVVLVVWLRYIVGISGDAKVYKMEKVFPLPKVHGKRESNEEEQDRRKDSSKFDAHALKLPPSSLSLRD